MQKYFRDCCKQLNIDCDTLFYTGLSHSTSGERLCYYINKEKSPLPIYAICYFQSMDIYVAWDLKNCRLKRNKLSIAKCKADKVIPNQIYKATKHVNNRGGEEETVYIFQPNSVKRFLETYILSQ